MGAHFLVLPKLILCSTTLFFIFASFGLAASAKLQSQEVKVLKEIGRKLGKKDWDFGKDPCSGEGSWKVISGWKSSESSVTCDCTFNNNSSCHIENAIFPFLFFSRFIISIRRVGLMLKRKKDVDGKLDEP
ncbi:hypothetical protein TorRG33x02_077830 [Trema orientale]|uniref:LRR domain containing protein n=1 Tax=Trema orientale TaxID=63057 RepID=A0A2P5FFD9_TREOI|nr:hypothetical protein TorRG33x02_077830 [Trema orientale]